MSGASAERAKAELRQRYDRFADAEAAGEQVGPARAYFRARKLECVLNGTFRSGVQLLEIGCARGQFTFPLARHGFRMSALDLSPTSVERARQRAIAEGLDIAFVVGDAERLEAFADDSFDGVVSF